MTVQPQVLLEIAGDALPSGVALITLNRPSARNALSQEMLSELAVAMQEAETCPDVAAVVITGSGTSFCAGLDLKEMAQDGANLRYAQGRPWPQLTKPLIAAVNGPAYTGGLELALSCDFIIASTRAVFADTHTRVGIVPFWGMSVLLPAAVGARTAAYMSLTGRALNAEEALRSGLVSAVVDESELLGSAFAAARDVVTAEPRSTHVLLHHYRRFAAVADFDEETKTAERFFSAAEFHVEEIESRRRSLMARRGDAEGER